VRLLIYDPELRFTEVLEVKIAFGIIVIKRDRESPINVMLRHMTFFFQSKLFSQICSI
jgi:uncharacterized protein YqgQ